MTVGKKRCLYIALALGTFLVSTATIFSSFYFSGSLQRMVNSVLKLEIYPPLIGGPVAHTVYDPMQDDTGCGTLVYPANRQFAEGNLDLVSYTVREPVFHAPWQDVPEYWQLELDFRTGFDEHSDTVRNRTIYIYLHIPGLGEGSLETLHERSELVSFDPGYPWHFALAVTGDNGVIYNRDGDRVDVLNVLYSNNGKKVFVKVPLTKKELQRFYTIDLIRHYVLVAAHSPLDTGGVLPVAKRKTRTAGGGARSRLTPRVYDLLSEGNQSDMLSSWNDSTFELARIEPVEIPMRKNRDAAFVVDHEKIEALEAERNTIAEKLRTEKKNRLDELRRNGTGALNDMKELAQLAFDLGDVILAEKLVEELRVLEPENPVWIAYTGSLESMKGDGAPVVAAIEAVQTGYRYLDDAVARTDGTLEKAENGSIDQAAIDQRTTALINRASTSKAVPNEVFIKALQGAHDYLEAAELFRLSGSELASANCYLDAAECFSLDGQTGEAALWKREAARLVRGCLAPDKDAFTEADRALLLHLQIALMKEGLL